MSFSAEWLALREPFDMQARNRGVRERVASLIRDPSVTIVDLACGTGATLRALGPYLPMQTAWRLIDHDASLLAKTPPAQNVQVRSLDLASDLDAALGLPVDLVTTSAFLDLVSLEWLERLVGELAVRQVPFYAALSYDGRIEFTPADPRDAAIISAVNHHQLKDKGFGPALGPRAAPMAVERLQHLGYAVEQGAADWLINEGDLAMQEAMLSGWASAARETGGISDMAIDGWLTDRRSALVAGRSSIRVGHQDFFAWPSERR